MLTMDTGKSSKGHEGHQENIQLPETEGNLRLGFLAKHLTHLGPKQQKMLTRVGGRLCRAQGQSFLLSLGPFFPEIQALSLHIGPGHSCGTQEIVVGLH